MATIPSEIEAGPTILAVKGPIPSRFEKALRRVMPRQMVDFVFGEIVVQLQGDIPKAKPPVRGYTYGGGENVSGSQYQSFMKDTYPDDEFGYDTIDEMLKTGQVRFALELKKAAILSALFNELQWQIQCQDKTLGKVVKADMERIFATYGPEMLSMLEYGSFFGELIWEYVPASARGLEGDEKWWVLEGINTVKPETVDYIRRVPSGKDMGRFDGFVQEASSPWPEHTVPVEQALILTCRKKWRNLWGESILKPAYPLWYWWNLILASLIHYLDKAGDPLVVAKAPMRGRMKKANDEWMSSMDYALLLATEATKSQAVAIPSDRHAETGESLFELGYMTDDKKGEQYIACLKLLSDLITRSIVMGAMADISKEGGGYNREEVRWGMTQLDNQMILQVFISQLSRYHLPKYATYNAGAETYLAMLLVGLDPDRIDRVFKFLSTAGNQADGGALDWPNWQLIFQLSGIPTVSKEEADKIKEERQAKAEKEEKSEGSEFDVWGKGGEEEAEEGGAKEKTKELMWQVLSGETPIWLSHNQLEAFARDNPHLVHDGSEIALFNPYHDPLGRFTSAAYAVEGIAMVGALAAYVVTAGAGITALGLSAAEKEYKKRGKKQALARVTKYKENAIRVTEVSARIGVSLWGVQIISGLAAMMTGGEAHKRYRDPWTETQRNKPTSWPRGVDDQRAHSAYRNFAKKFHPDVARGMSKKQATEKFRTLKDAYDKKDWSQFEKWAKETGIKLEEVFPGPVLEDQAVLYRILKDVLADKNEWIFFDVDADIDWLPKVDGMYVMHHSQAQYIVSLLEEMGKVPMQAFRELEQDAETIQLFNPHHDELGRFATKGRGVGVSHIPADLSPADLSVTKSVVGSVDNVIDSYGEGEVSRKKVKQWEKGTERGLAIKNEANILRETAIKQYGHDAVAASLTDYHNKTYVKFVKNILVDLGDSLWKEAYNVERGAWNEPLREQYGFEQDTETIKLVNPYHDELGRFTSKAGATKTIKKDMQGMTNAQKERYLRGVVAGKQKVGVKGKKSEKPNLRHKEVAQAMLAKRPEPGTIQARGVGVDEARNELAKDLAGKDWQTRRDHVEDVLRSKASTAKKLAATEALNALDEEGGPIISDARQHLERFRNEADAAGHKTTKYLANRYERTQSRTISPASPAYRFEVLRKVLSGQIWPVFYDSARMLLPGGREAIRQKNAIKATQKAAALRGERGRIRQTFAWMSVTVVPAVGIVGGLAAAGATIATAPWLVVGLTTGAIASQFLAEEPDLTDDEKLKLLFFAAKLQYLLDEEEASDILLPATEYTEHLKEIGFEELEGALHCTAENAQKIIDAVENIVGGEPGGLEEETTGPFELFNPYHDEKGRFTTGPGVGASAIPKSKVKYGAKPGGKLMFSQEKFERKVHRQAEQLSGRLPGCENPPEIWIQDANFRYAGAHLRTNGGIILLPFQTVIKIQRKDAGFGHHALLHEKIHARKRTSGRMKPGSWQEEAATELLARKIYKDIYGSASPSTAYNRYVERLGRAAWKASGGDTERAWKYVDDAHNGSVKIPKSADGRGWETMLGATYKFEEADDLMEQLLDLIEQKKWKEAKALVEAHPDDDSLVFVFGEMWTAEFGIEETEPAGD